MLKDMIKYCKEEDEDLIFILKLIDYVFSIVKVDIDSDKEVQSFVNNTRILANLYTLMGLTMDLSDRQRAAYDSAYLTNLIVEPKKILGLQQFKLKLHRSVNADLIPKFEDYRASKGI